MVKYLILITWLLPVSAISGSFPVLGSGRDGCESLWIERNQIINTAGYCFETVLGQSVFDNSDCVPGAVALPETSLDRISQIERAEGPRACDINTEMALLTVNGRYGPLRFGIGAIQLGRWPNVLAEMDVFPRESGRERSCTVSGLSNSGDGFLALRSGPDVRYPQIGQLFNGDRVVSTSVCMGRWCFSDSVRIGNVQESLNGWFHANWCE